MKLRKKWRRISTQLSSPSSRSSFKASFVYEFTVIVGLCNCQCPKMVLELETKIASCIKPQQNVWSRIMDSHAVNDWDFILLVLEMLAIAESTISFVEDPNSFSFWTFTNLLCVRALGHTFTRRFWKENSLPKLFSQITNSFLGTGKSPNTLFR